MRILTGRARPPESHLATNADLDAIVTDFVKTESIPDGNS